MATQTREQGRYLGARPPYGYRIADAGGRMVAPAGVHPPPTTVDSGWGQ